MRRLRLGRASSSATRIGLTGLALTLLASVALRAQVTGLEANVIVLEKAAQNSCPGCGADDPKLLISKAAAAIRIDMNDAGDTLLVQVIPLNTSRMAVAQLKVDGVGARLEDGAWWVERAAKMRKKAPRIEILCADGQELSFKPQHRPHQGPVGGLILPQDENQPEKGLRFHKKSFWADSLG